MQGLDGPGSSVMEWELDEPRELLKSAGFAVGLKASGVKSEGWDFISRSGLAVLDLWSCLSGSTRARRYQKLKAGAADLARSFGPQINELQRSWG